MSSESIASPPSPARAAERCTSCGAPLAGDQRYCLECGERRAPISSELLAGTPGAPAAQTPGAPFVLGPSAAGGESLSRGPRECLSDAAPRANTVTVIAGVGVLLLAMGVGVLIGRSGGSSRSTAVPAPQIVSVAAAPSGTAPGASEATPFSDDWPAGTNGYTVELQTLTQASTQTSAVEAAEAAAAAKGAKGVGALKSEDFPGLTPGSYIVYSGVFHDKPRAETALAALKKSFPGASVLRVLGAGTSRSGASPSGAAGTGAGSGSGTGSSPSKPASPKVLEKLTKKSGKSYEQESKNLPNVVGT